MSRKLTWKRDPSYADLPKHVLKLTAAPLPLTTDLEPLAPPCYDQGQLGSCTAHAICGVFHIKEMIEGRNYGTPARLFVYQMELLIQRTWGEDDGSTIPTGMRAVLSYGLPPEAQYPYTDNVAALSVNPSPGVYTLGRLRRATQAMEVAVPCNHQNIVSLLAANTAIAAGFEVPQSFMGEAVAATGVWAGPQAKDPIVGGHAIAIVGHNDVAATYKIRNSWGTSWGKNGYVEVPQSFVHAQFSDLMAAVDAPK